MTADRSFARAQRESQLRDTAAGITEQPGNGTVASRSRW